MADETPDARMDRLLRTLPPALRGMGFGDPDDAEYAHASDVVAWAIKEIDRLREERRSISTLLQKVETLEAALAEKASVTIPPGWMNRERDSQWVATLEKVGVKVKGVGP